MKALGKKIENMFALEYLRDEERPRQFDRVVQTVRPRKELKAPGLQRR